MAKTAVARMVTKDVSKSKKLPTLSPDALNLFFMLIPHLDCHGKMKGDPYFVRGVAVPRFDRFTPEIITTLLKEISEKTNVKWFQVDDLWYIHAVNFKEHQPGLREDRMGEDLLPSYPTEKSTKSSQIPELSGVIPPEVEVEVGSRKEKYEVEGGMGETKKTVSPDVKIFLDYAYQAFLKKTGEKLLIEGKKDGVIVKRLLGTYGLEKLKGLWDAFMQSDDPFILRAGRSIGVFKTQINKLLTAPNSIAAGQIPARTAHNMSLLEKRRREGRYDQS